MVSKIFSNLSVNLEAVRDRSVNYILTVVSTEEKQQIIFKDKPTLQFFLTSEIQSVHIEIPSDYNGDPATLIADNIILKCNYEADRDVNGSELCTDDLLMLADIIYAIVNNQ